MHPTFRRLGTSELLPRYIFAESLYARRRVLEVGAVASTGGQSAQLLAQRGARSVLAVDDDLAAVEAARKSLGNASVRYRAAVFDDLAPELEKYGFELMRLSGRTVAIKAIPGDLPGGEARNMLAELLDTVDAEKKNSAAETLRDEIAASLACHAAIKVNMPLAPEKMRWLTDRLLQTSSPTTCPHGRPVILRLRTRDILKGFHRI